MGMIKDYGVIMKSRRIVVTGIGVVTSLGIGWNKFWDNLLHGKSGISEVTSFDTSQYDRHYAGEVKDFNPNQFLSKNKVKLFGRASQMVMSAAHLAIDDANIDLSKLNREMIVVCIGTTTGEIQLLEKYNDRKHRWDNKFQRRMIAVYPPNILSACIGMEFDIKNYNNVISTACAAGNYAIGYAYDLIKLHKADYAIVGGADAFSRIVFTGFGRLLAIAPKICQPFDKNRKGMIPGEGAGVLFIETYESEKKRKKEIYAEILGYGLSCDAFHVTHPNKTGIAKAIKKAMESAGIKKDEVDYISAHGTGTRENDKAEASAIREVFGKRSNEIPASSIKSMLGHTMGAASALEAIACCLSIKFGKIPPTINYKQPDPECNIDCVPNIFREKKVHVALNNSSAFGGNNACLVFRSGS